MPQPPFPSDFLERKSSLTFGEWKGTVRANQILQWNLSDVQKQTHLEKKSFVYSYVFHGFLSFPEMIFYTFFHAPIFS